MKVFDINDMKGGWFIGNFEPSVLKTTTFEVGILKHTKGEEWPKHKHEHLEEYNYLVSGKMFINNTEINSGDVFVFQRGEIADPVFLEDCLVVVIKVPSVPGDKVIIED